MRVPSQRDQCECLAEINFTTILRLALSFEVSQIRFDVLSFVQPVISFGLELFAAFFAHS